MERGIFFKFSLDLHGLYVRIAAFWHPSEFISLAGRGFFCNEIGFPRAQCTFAWIFLHFCQLDRVCEPTTRPKRQACALR